MKKALIDLSEVTEVSCDTDNIWTLFGPPGTLSKMPVTHRDQIHVLDQAFTLKAYDAFNQTDLLSGDDGWGNQPFAGNPFKRVETFHMLKDSDKDLKKWLYQRGIPFSNEVLLLPVFKSEDEPAILTTWKIVIKNAQELFEMDNLVIVSNHADWCLYYHHDGLITVGQEPDAAKWHYYQ